MLDLALLRADAARVRAALERRGAWADRVDAAVDLDRRWSARREVREALRTRRRQISDEVARRKSAAGAEQTAEAAAPDLLRAGRRAGRDLKAVEDAMADLSARREAALLALPNLPADDVPDAPPAPDPSGPAWPHAFPPLAHWDLVEMLHLAEPAASAGRGFVLWRGAGARLVRGLVRFMLGVHTEEGGREEVLAPPLATRAALVGSAHLPTLEGMLYAVAEPGGDRSLLLAASEGAEDRHATDADLYLAPRAEPHLASLYAGQVLEAGRLPIRLVAAATAHRHTPHGGGPAGRGLLRLGAFPTVEVYTLCRPAESDAELERALAGAETILARLEVAHRRRERAVTELSHAAARSVSLDVWCPGLPRREEDDEGEHGRWVEAAVLSSFTDYQARRTETQFRGADGRPRLVHTVGGAAVAVPRLVTALLETGQEEDGAVRLPAALERYVGMGVLDAPNGPAR